MKAAASYARQPFIIASNPLPHNQLQHFINSVLGNSKIKQLDIMELSQNRTRAVLEYVLSDTDISQNKRDWVKTTTTANGLSSSKLIYENGIENKERSRRVEFRVRTNAEMQIVKILTAGK